MIVDVNVHLSRWPFRHLPCDSTPKLLRKLESQNVISAWAGSFDALLHRDMAGVNSRLADECTRTGRMAIRTLSSATAALAEAGRASGPSRTHSAIRASGRSVKRVSPAEIDARSRAGRSVSHRSERVKIGAAGCY